MQQVLHYSPLQSGVAWLAASLTSIALASLSQWLVTRGGAKVVMAIGISPVAATAGPGQLASSPTASRASPHLRMATRSTSVSSRSMGLEAFWRLERDSYDMARPAATPD
jgi:hypothetical protein